MRGWKGGKGGWPGLAGRPSWRGMMGICAGGKIIGTAPCHGRGRGHDYAPWFVFLARLAAGHPRHKNERRSDKWHELHHTLYACASKKGGLAMADHLAGLLQTGRL